MIDGVTGISYVARACDGVIKIGFTTRSVRARMTVHRKAELERGHAPPELLISFPSTSAFDRAITDRLWKHRTPRGNEWFAPVPEVLSVVERLLAAANTGVLPTVYTEEEQTIRRECERTGMAAYEERAARLRSAGEQQAYEEGFLAGIQHAATSSKSRGKR